MINDLHRCLTAETDSNTAVTARIETVEGCPLSVEVHVSVDAHGHLHGRVADDLHDRAWMSRMEDQEIALAGNGDHDIRTWVGVAGRD
jgi:hypothetical protein